MACCWRVTPLVSVAIKARGLAAEVAQKEDLLALLAELTLDCSSFLPLRASSSAGNIQSLMRRRGLLNVKVLIKADPLTINWTDHVMACWCPSYPALMGSHAYLCSACSLTVHAEPLKAELPTQLGMQTLSTKFWRIG